LAGPFSLAPVLAAAGIGLAIPFLVLALVPGLVAGRLPAAPTHLLPVLGFLAAGGTVWLLYRLGRGVDSAGLAWVELALVALSLLAWVRARAAGRTVRAVLALALLVAFVSVPWLAHQHRRVHLTEGGRQ
jgi:suppressor for copper-sensitivity B